MPKYHLLRSYGQMAGSTLGELALHVGTSMTGNVNFTTPPITPAFLTTSANNYIASAASAVDSNKLATATKLAQQSALITSLDQLADYVELNSQNNPTKLLSSGFGLAKTSRTKKVVGTTGIAGVTNLATTKLKLALVVAANAKCYVVQISTTPNEWVTVAVFTNPRDAVLTGLTPGVTYAIRACAMGSNNQTSEWCDTVSHMST